MSVPNIKLDVSIIIDKYNERRYSTCTHSELFWPATITSLRPDVYISMVDHVHIPMLERCGGGAGSSLHSHGL